MYRPLDQLELDAKVRDGIALMDVTDPGWRDTGRTGAVEPLLLDMDNDGYCILGQRYEMYEIGCNEVGLEDQDDAIDHGFILSNLYHNLDTYDPLRQAAVIQLRDTWLRLAWGIE